MSPVRLYRLLLKKGLEPFLVKTIGRNLWAPCSVAVLAEGEHNDILALDMGDRYSLPGGLITAGEGLRSAARREFNEETGFKVELGELLDIRTVAEGNEGIHFFFRGKVVGGEKTGTWEGEPEFMPKDEIRDRIWKLEHSHIHEYLFPDQ